LRYARRLTDRQPFGRAAEVGGVRRAHRDRADERPIGDTNDRGVGRRTAVRRDEQQIATHRPDARAGRAIARHRNRGASPAFAGGPLGKRQPRAAGRGDVEGQLLATHHLLRQSTKLDLRQERAVPRLHWQEQREQSVAEDRRDPGEQQHADRRRGEGAAGVASRALARGWRERRTRAAETRRHLRRRMPTEGPAIRDLEGAS
jgi:hypothetical protein